MTIFAALSHSFPISIAINDDQYLALEMPQSAFHSPLYGPVFRVDTGRPVGGDDSGQAGGEHEWRSMGWSDHLLSGSFFWISHLIID